MDLRSAALVVLLVGLVAGAWWLGIADDGRTQAVARSPQPIAPHAEPIVEHMLRGLAGPRLPTAELGRVFSGLQEWALQPKHVVVLLEHRDPRVVRFGIKKVGAQAGDASVRRALRALLEDTAKERFRSTLNADDLFRLQREAGLALGADLTRLIQARAEVLLARIRAALIPGPGPFDLRPKRTAEEPRGDAWLWCVRGLADLGPEARPVVAEHAAEPVGDVHRDVLDMGLAALGDRARVPVVARLLTESKDPGLRWAAAGTLEQLRDRTTIPALKKALRDPYVQEPTPSGPDVRWWPVRNLAYRALVAMGEDPHVLQALLRDDP